MPDTLPWIFRKIKLLIFKFFKKLKYSNVIKNQIGIPNPKKASKFKIQIESQTLKLLIKNAGDLAMGDEIAAPVDFVAREG